MLVLLNLEMPGDPEAAAQVKIRIRDLILAGFVAMLLAALTFVFLDRRSPSEIVIQPGTVPGIVVDISGGVATPGVYELPGSSRLQQAIDEAGGLTADADVSSLNLAGRLGDGEKVVIPTGNVAIRAPSTGATPESDRSASADELINLNSADAVELDSLPGVGPVIAERIVAYRAANGPFASVDQLAEIEGISDAMVEEFRPLVTIGD